MEQQKEKKNQKRKEEEQQRASNWIMGWRKTYLKIWPFFWEFCLFWGNFWAVSAHVHFFLFFVRKWKRKKKTKKRKRRGRGVKGKGVTKKLGILVGIRQFSNSQNSQLFWEFHKFLLSFSPTSKFNFRLFWLIVHRSSTNTLILDVVKFKFKLYKAKQQHYYK